MRGGGPVPDRGGRTGVKTCTGPATLPFPLSGDAARGSLRGRHFCCACPPPSREQRSLLQKETHSRYKSCAQGEPMRITLILIAVAGGSLLASYLLWREMLNPTVPTLPAAPSARQRQFGY